MLKVRSHLTVCNYDSTFLPICSFKMKSKSNLLKIISDLASATNKLCPGLEVYNWLYLISAYIQAKKCLLKERILRERSLIYRCLILFYSETTFLCLRTILSLAGWRRHNQQAGAIHLLFKIQELFLLEIIKY